MSQAVRCSRFFCRGALALLALAAGAAAAPPRLIVAISVDQFSADLYGEYRSLYRGGLRRLSTGVVFPSGYQSHAATETCPGHSTILTGARPARTGIIANEWIDQDLPRANKQVYCAEDPRVADSTPSHYVVSALNLKVPTLGDRLKALDPASRVVAVAGKDRAAVMMGGHRIDEAWFWDINTRAFATLPGALAAPPPIIASVNARIARAIAQPAPPALPSQCRSRSVPVTVADHTVGVLSTRPAGDAKVFRTSPEFDQATTDIAIDRIRALKLGQGAATDVVAIGLSATDYVGHTFGTEGAEMCAQILGVDANVGRILDALDKTRVPYAVVLTADHGGLDVPERSRLRGISEARRVEPELDPVKVGAALASEFALQGPVLMGAGSFGDIYLSRQVPEGLRARVLARARERYLSSPEVAAVYTGAQLRMLTASAAPASDWSLAERFRASFDEGRSGDLIVASAPYVTMLPLSSGYAAHHGSPWSYDRRVPILFYWPGIAGFEQPLPVETVDILPTLAALVGLKVPPSEIDGHALSLVPGGP